MVSRGRTLLARAETRLNDANFGLMVNINQNSEGLILPTGNVLDPTNTMPSNLAISLKEQGIESIHVQAEPL